ncbi:MAG: RidA family protein [Saprospiraceae bacterium]
MKKNHWTILGLIAFLFLGLNPVLTAQETTKESKKVVIITKKIDKNGKETVEKIVREGADIDGAEIDKLIEKAKKEGGEIDVRIKKEQRKVIKKSKDGKTENIWIEIDGETIDIDKMKGAGDVMIFKTEDGKLIKLDGEELHEEHIIIEEDAKGKAGEEVEVSVTVDEDGNTTRIEKRIVKQKKQAEEMEVTVSVDEDGNTKIITKRKKVADVEAKLEKMGIKLPVLGKPVANYVHAVTSNNQVYLAGKGPRKADGKNIVGKLGKDLTVDEGYEAAKWAGINLLAALKGEIGNLNRVTRIVKVNGMVNAIPEFTDHSKVINGFSDLMVEVFGDKGKHARAAVGMSSLPGNMAVEIEMVVEIE